MNKTMLVVLGSKRVPKEGTLMRLARLVPLLVVLLLVSCFSAQADDPMPAAAPGSAGGGPEGSGAAIPRLDLEELVNQADLIVVGTVDSLNSYWNPEHTRIFTNVGVSVERVIKGTPRGEVVVRAPGGTAEGITEWVSEAPGFAVGERALLFLKSEEEGIHSLANWRWGKQIVEDERVLPMNLALSRVISDVGEILRKQGLPTPGGDLVEKEASFTLPTPLSRTRAAPGPPAATGWQDIMTEDFEGTFPGTTWTLDGDPTWGKDDYKPYTGAYSGWCARGGTSGLDPQYNNYPNNMNAWMVYGPFSLSDATDAELNFYFWLDSEPTYDWLIWMASVNGSDFYGSGVSGDSTGWAYQSFDLTDVYTLGNLAGQSSVWVAFWFLSDSIGVDKGAFLDDIVLRKFVAVGPAPTISSITPSSASAGTGSNVTISGSNFGATQGSSKVTFYYKAGEPRIEATIVSWNDTSIVATVPVGIINSYPASASSGPVIVTTAGGDSNGYHFAVTFSYIGAKWPGASPDVHYRVNPNTADVTGEEVAVQAAANTWNTVSGTDFQFVYDGATSATEYGYNGTNEVMWRNLGATGTIAVNYLWTDASGNSLEFDQEYNDSYTWSTTGAGGTYDVQNIATHELGHALGLRDLYGDVGSPNDTEKTMYGFAATGETKKRTLEPDDRAGVIWIYPASVMPDLVVTSVSNPPSEADPGDSFSVTDTTHNQGTDTAFSSTTGYYLSTDQNKNGDDILLTGSRSVPDLASGASSTDTVTVTVPGATPDGTYYLLACADDTGAVAESNENNNCLASTGTIDIGLQPDLPDLVVTSMSNPPSEANRGESFSVTDTTHNQDAGTASASTTRYYLSTDQNKNGGDTLLTGSRSVPSLGSGASSTDTVTVTVPGTTPDGTYYLLACADDTGAVAESNENNNCRASTSTIQVPRDGEPEATVRMGSGYVAPGGDETVRLEALNVLEPGVCMVVVDVIYDPPGLKTATACDADPDGRFENALCNVLPDRIALTVSRTADGLTGDFPLADITFHADPDAPMGAINPLDVDVRTFANCEGTDIPVADVDGENTIGMLGDVDCDSDMDGVDALFCLQYQVYIKDSHDYCPAPPPPPPDFIYGPAADVDGDTDVDGVDCLFMLQCLVYIPNVLCPSS